jgi:hypothetical protein
MRVIYWNIEFMTYETSLMNLGRWFISSDIDEWLVRRVDWWWEDDGR